MSSCDTANRNGTEQFQINSDGAKLNRGHALRQATSFSQRRSSFALGTGNDNPQGRSGLRGPACRAAICAAGSSALYIEQSKAWKEAGRVYCTIDSQPTALGLSCISFCSTRTPRGLLVSSCMLLVLSQPLPILKQPSPVFLQRCACRHSPLLQSPVLLASIYVSSLVTSCHSTTALRPRGTASNSPQVAAFPVIL